MILVNCVCFFSLYNVFHIIIYYNITLHISRYSTVVVHQLQRESGTIYTI